MDYETVVGLEIHAELKTATKMFCACRNDPFGAPEPNLYICPVCLGLPGTLPVMNRQAVEWTVLVGLALGCEIGWPTKGDRAQGIENSLRSKPFTLNPPRSTKWDRKNYFYPDLPKGYQISQYDLPICHKGELGIRNNELGEKGIEITRIHLEEDTGKLVHPPSPKASEGQVRAGANYSLIDYNRAGVPLMELVTEPVIRSGEEAAAFASEYQLVLRTLGISDADMEKGQMRVEANISVRPVGSATLGTKVEVKNLNSIKSVRQAIAYETKRHIEVIESGGQLVQETRGWDEAKQRTFSQRVKETAADYRYFPEPDLPPVTFTESQKSEVNEGIDIDRLRQQLPEMPWAKRKRYQALFQISASDADRMVINIEINHRFLMEQKALPEDMKDDRELNRMLIKWLLNLSDWQIIRPGYLAELFVVARERQLPESIIKKIYEHMKDATDLSPRAIVEKEKIQVVSDTTALEAITHEVIATNAQAVHDYKGGKGQALGALVGQVMAKTKGQADPQAVQTILQQILSKEGDDTNNDPTKDS